MTLYRGELLPEARYCEWVEPRRRFLVHAHLDAVKRLAALCRDEGNLFEAAWAAQLGLLVDDLDEELVESWLLTLSDRRANRRLDAALRTYSDRLEEELGVRPSDRLLALATNPAPAGAAGSSQHRASGAEPSGAPGGRACTVSACSVSPVRRITRNVVPADDATAV